MSSRAALLLEKERYFLIEKKGLPKGIEISHYQENIFHWRCTITGPRGSMWEGGVFLLDIYFSEEFDEIPPLFFFVTVPFHPNIDMTTGRPRVPEIEYWTPGQRLAPIFKTMMAMLWEPDLSEPVNPYAAELYHRRPKLFRQIARDCVVASQRLHAGLPMALESDDPFGTHEKDHASIEEDSSPIKKTSAVSFEDYFSQWKSLATSVPKFPIQPNSNQTFQSLLKSAYLGENKHAHLSEAQLKRLVQRHRLLWYGNFSKISQESEALRRKKAWFPGGFGFKSSRPPTKMSLKHPVYGNHIPRLSTLKKKNKKKRKKTNGYSSTDGEDDLQTPETQLELSWGDLASKRAGSESGSDSSSWKPRDSRPSSANTLDGIAEPRTNGGKKSWEDEADELVEWTKELKMEDTLHDDIAVEG